MKFFASSGEQTGPVQQGSYASSSSFHPVISNHIQFISNHFQSIQPLTDVWFQARVSSTNGPLELSAMQHQFQPFTEGWKIFRRNDIQECVLADLHLLARCSFCFYLYRRQIQHRQRFECEALIVTKWRAPWCLEMVVVQHFDELCLEDKSGGICAFADASIGGE